MPKSFQNLKADVVDKGLCTGCGTCVGVCPHHCLSMQKERGEPEPALTDKCPGCNVCYAVCPGKDIPLQELEQYSFGATRRQSPQDIGIYRFFGQGHASSRETQGAGASGGLVSALLKYAFDFGLVDGALLAGFDDENPYITKPFLVTSGDRVLEYAQSKYAMVSVNELLGEAIQSGIKKLAVVGCPCHIEGVRKLQMHNLRPSIAKKITLMVGLFCGSQSYLEGTRHVLVEECGIENLRDIRRLQYRGGEWPGGLIVDKVDGDRLEVERHHYMYHILLPGWRRDRCMMCLDWSSELSDISVGDNFAAPAENETPLGESSFIVRSELGEKIIKDAEEHEYVKTRPLEIEFILGSMGFELKKHSAGYRWTQRRLYGWPTPDYQYTPNFNPIMKKTHFAPEKKK